MAIDQAQQRITQAVLSWPGMNTAAHRFGGSEYRLGSRQIGHIHGDYLVDIPFPKKVRDQVVSAGQAEPHHILPESGWVSLFLRQEGDVQRAIDLLRRSYDLAVQQKKPRQATSGK
jgi:Ni,Fe-hydrogenase I large subunit